MTFKPRVLVAHSDDNKTKELRWLGKFLIKGLFDGEHYFTLQEHDDGSTTFIHGEKFTGILLPLLKKQLLTETKAGFEQMNNALKVACEKDV